MGSDKIKLVLLLLMTALPIGLATWMFSRQEGQGLETTTNKGELIIPVLDVTDLGMQDRAGEPLFRTFEETVADISLDDYQPRPWLLVYLGGPDCARDCEERLFYLRQLHRRLGAEAARVQRYYVNLSEDGRPLGEDTRALFEARFPDMGVAYGDAARTAGNLAPSVDPGEEPVRDHYIYVVDPVGNVMLYFTPDNTPEEILSDIDKLLERSSLG